MSGGGPEDSQLRSIELHLQQLLNLSPGIVSPAPLPAGRAPPATAHPYSHLPPPPPEGMAAYAPHFPYGPYYGHPGYPSQPSQPSPSHPYPSQPYPSQPYPYHPFQSFHQPPPPFPSQPFSAPPLHALLESDLLPTFGLSQQHPQQPQQIQLPQPLQQPLQPSSFEEGFGNTPLVETFSSSSSNKPGKTILPSDEPTDQSTAEQRSAIEESQETGTSGELTTAAAAASEGVEGAEGEDAAGGSNDFPTLDPEEPVEWPSDQKMGSLEGEMMHFLRNLPRPPNAGKKSQLLARLNYLVGRRFPGLSPRLHLFGSSANDLCVGKGDIDLCLVIHPDAGSRVEVIEELGQVLSKAAMQDVQVLSKARIPIVKFFDPRTRQACDVCCNNTLALRNTQMLADYARLDPRMRMLVLLVKSWAKRRDLNDPYHGSLSSYAYVLLVIFFLQTRDPPILPCLQEHKRPQDPSRIPMEEGFDVYSYQRLHDLAGIGSANQASVAGLLLGFFRFYGWEFDFQYQVVSIRKGQPVSKEDKGWVKGQSKTINYMCIEDPFETSHNLGKSVRWRHFKMICREFRRAYRVLATRNIKTAFWARPPPPAPHPRETNKSSQQDSSEIQEPSTQQDQPQQDQVQQDQVQQQESESHQPS